MPPVIVFLARTIDIVASADRGAYDESLSEICEPCSNRDSTASQAKEIAAADALDSSALLAICDAYYQRLLQGGQFEVARRPWKCCTRTWETPPSKQFASRPAQSAQHDRQTRTGHRGNRCRRQASKPGRSQRRRRPGGLLGKLVPPQFDRGGHSSKSSLSVQRPRLSRRRHQCRHAPGRSPRSSKPSCPMSADSSWTTTSAGPI